MEMGSDPIFSFIFLLNISNLLRQGCAVKSEALRFLPQNHTIAVFRVFAAWNSCSCCGPHYSYSVILLQKER